MTKIDSPLGTKNFNQTGRRFVVENSEFSNEDFNDEVDEMEFQKEVAAHRELRKNPEKQRMSSSSKDRLNFLLGLTKLESEITIEGVTFRFKTLSSKDNREAVAESNKFLNTLEFPFEVRRQFLARALFGINSMSFADFIQSNSLVDKVSFIDSLDEGLCTLLYGAYTKLVKEANDKYGINKQEEVTEVLEDLKK